MSEDRIEQDASAWAVCLAMVDEFVHEWRAQVLEYDVIPAGGTIRLRIAVDPRSRNAARKAMSEHAGRFLADAEKSLRHSRDKARDARVCSDQARRRQEAAGRRFVSRS